MRQNTTSGPTHPVPARDRRETIVGKIEPQPPKGIKYMLGAESWLPASQQTPRRLHCEEWGSLGPIELNPEIRPNKAGFRVRCTTVLAPAGALGFVELDGVYYWTDMTIWERMKRDTPPASPARTEEG